MILVLRAYNTKLSVTQLAAPGMGAPLTTTLREANQAATSARTTSLYCLNFGAFYFYKQP